MKEYNKLTQKLISDGYTVENHPDYVYVTGWGEKKTLDNFDGGFKYYGWAVYEKTYITPCGLHYKGKFAHAGTSWRGMDYSYENNNPIIVCPKDCANCNLRDEPFRSFGDGCLRFNCPVHETDKEWTYTGSVEEIRNLYDDEIRRKKASFILQKNNRVCEHHMFYNKDIGEWEFNYDPLNCANGFCRAQQSAFEDGGFCPVLQKAISKEKGNVYYDVKYEGRDYSKDGTLFEGERFVQIIKGRPLFDKPIRLDIAKVIAKLCTDHIRWKVRWNSRDFDSLTMFLAERGERDLKWEVMNIRAEKKVSRDFEQDLKDIDDGITVTHEVDEAKKKKAEKHEKREEAKRKRVKWAENQVRKYGYDNLEFSDQHRICKLLNVDRIDELDNEHYEQEEKEKREPKQMSLFDGG